MGIIYYGDARHPVPVEDRALAHIKVVIVSKLRRGESCTFSWASEGDHRETIWLSPYIPLHFVFDSVERPPLNREWLELLAQAAATPGGLFEVPEPAETNQAQPQVAKSA